MEAPDVILHCDVHGSHRLWPDMVESWFRYHEGKMCQGLRL